MKKFILLSAIMVLGAMGIYATPTTSTDDTDVMAMRGSPPLAAASLNTTDKTAVTGTITAEQATLVFNLRIDDVTTASPPATFNFVNTRNADANNAALNNAPPISSTLTLTSNTTTSTAKIAMTDESPPAAQTAQYEIASGGTTNGKLNTTTATAESPPANIATAMTFNNFANGSYAIYTSTTARLEPDVTVLRC